MKLRVHPKEWGPLQHAAALVAAAAVIGLGIWLGRMLWPSPPEKPPLCGKELKEVRGECVGVTAHAFHVDNDGIRELLDEIEKNNVAIHEKYASGGGSASDSYVRVLLTMPFTYDEKSAMTEGMIRHALAGALAAQDKANSGAAPRLQLLLAPNGKNLNRWPYVNEQLPGWLKKTKTPLVGVTGIPSSTQETADAAKALSRSDLELPTIAPLVSSETMSAKYLFKTSPNNREFVNALKEYLKDHTGSVKGHPLSERGFLVLDAEKDDYAKNLREVLEDEFEDTWGLGEDRRAVYSGITGGGKASTQRFSTAQRKICRESATDTVFFAGRDQDLSKLVQKLADEPCGDDRELRILKVGTGFDPSLTGQLTRDRLQDAQVTLVNASSVDTSWWDAEEEAPDSVRKFLADIKRTVKSHDLDLDLAHPKSLNDGYAAMSFDGVRALTNAVDDRYSEWEREDPQKMPNRYDVYQAFQNTYIDENGCSTCLKGASGKYNFVGTSHDQWSVCKPVPVLELRPGMSEPKVVDDPPYRTYEETIKEGCPSG